MVAFACVTRQCFGSGLETFSTSWPLIQGTEIKLTKIKKTPKKPIQSKMNCRIKTKTKTTEHTQV